MTTIPITLTGTIAMDPESRTLPTGRACASFRMAVNHWRVDKDTGEFVSDDTSWFGVDCYGPLASNVAMSLKRGMAVVVQGALKNREWETAEKKGVSPTVVADHIGPDLRYGTANYQRAKGSARDAAAEDSGGRTHETSGTDGWGNIEGTAPQTPTMSDGGFGAEEPEDTDGEPLEARGDEATDGDGGVRTDSMRSGDDSSEGDAIARETAAAAAPF